METISEREEAVRPGTKRKAAEVTDDEEGGGGGHRWMRRKAGGGGVAIYTQGGGEGGELKEEPEIFFWHKNARALSYPIARKRGRQKKKMWKCEREKK